jgi:hypothetical protein
MRRFLPHAWHYDLPDRPQDGPQVKCSGTRVNDVRGGVDGR